MLTRSEHNEAILYSKKSECTDYEKRKVIQYFCKLFGREVKFSRINDLNGFEYARDYFKNEHKLAKEIQGSGKGMQGLR